MFAVEAFKMLITLLMIMISALIPKKYTFEFLNQYSELKYNNYIFHSIFLSIQCHFIPNNDTNIIFPTDSDKFRSTQSAHFEN